MWASIDEDGLTWLYQAVRCGWQINIRVGKMLCDFHLGDGEWRGSDVRWKGQMFSSCPTEHCLVSQHWQLSCWQRLDTRLSGPVPDLIRQIPCLHVPLRRSWLKMLLVITDSFSHFSCQIELYSPGNEQEYLFHLLSLFGHGKTNATSLCWLLTEWQLSGLVCI